MATSNAAADALGRSMRAFMLLCAESEPFPIDQKGAAAWVLSANACLGERLAAGSSVEGPGARRLAVLLRAGLDTDAIGQLALSWRWTVASGAERAAFGVALRSLLVREIGSQLLGLERWLTTIVSVRTGRSASNVVTEMTRAPQTAALHVVWELRPHGDDWRVSNIIVEEVSLAAVLASRFEQAAVDTGDDLQPALTALRCTAGT